MVVGKKTAHDSSGGLSLISYIRGCGTMVIIGLIISILIAVGGGVSFILCRCSRPLHDFEIESMKRDGLFEGEPEYMQTFRVAQAEWDLEDNLAYTRYARIVFWIGCVGIIVCVAILFT